ncbi:hypothetical protein EDC94DRAFT_609103 [Helicostylum pulchrum]|nr:hypothetical protein EDC94DRAFT_609103 [Helicostylum pulchrum]
MSSLPSPPPSPLDRRRHRRGDSFALLQTIIKEEQKLEQKEDLIKSKLIRFSYPPKLVDNSIEIIPRKSLSHHSVRFTTEPPKVYHYTV